MSTGRRYDSEPKLNLKKVFGVIIAFAVIVMIIVTIIRIVKTSNNKVEVKRNTYYVAYENGNFGVINNNGEYVIKPQYIEMIAIPNNTKPIFVCTLDVDDELGTYKTKVVNENNEQILSGYDQIEAIENSDSKNNIWFEDNVLRVNKNGKYGLIDFNGKELIPCEYDEIISLKAVKGEFLIKKAGNIGLVNDKGQTIIPALYKEIRTLKEGYTSEYIIINENDKFGIIGTSGNILIEPAYEDVKYLNSDLMFAVKEEGIWKLYNTSDSNIVIDGGYDNIIEIKNENNLTIVKDEKYGIINLENKEEIVSAEYEDLKYAFDIYYIAKKDGKFGIINNENQEIVPFEYINMIFIENGSFIQADKDETETVIFDMNLEQKLSGIVSEVNIDKGYIKIYTNSEYKYYNFKLEEKTAPEVLLSNSLFLSKKDGKYGYVDKEGKTVIDYIYEDGTEQNSCGFAAVKKDGLWGSINAIGAVSKEPDVNLDDSIFIDFIGEWHLSNSGLYYQK